MAIPIKATITIHTELGDLVGVLWDHTNGEGVITDEMLKLKKD